MGGGKPNLESPTSKKQTTGTSQQKYEGIMVRKEINPACMRRSAGGLTGSTGKVRVRESPEFAHSLHHCGKAGHALDGGDRGLGILVRHGNLSATVFLRAGHGKLAIRGNPRVLLDLLDGWPLIGQFLQDQTKEVRQVLWQIRRIGDTV